MIENVKGHAMEDLITTAEKHEDCYTEREKELIQELIKIRREKDQELEYEQLDDYEVPPITKFSMLNKPQVTIKFRQMTFNMACIKLFEGVKFVLPIANSKRKRLALIMCNEEETSSVEWAKKRVKDGKWKNKTITAPDFVEDIYKMMEWDRNSRYKVVGHIANSERGLILVFDLVKESYILSASTYIDKETGEKKRCFIKYLPDEYKDRIGRSYSDYYATQQFSLFEPLDEYSGQIKPE